VGRATGVLHRARPAAEREDDHGNGLTQREAFELKVWKDGKPDPLERALSQLDTYLARLRLGTGTLVIFDHRKQPAPVSERGTTATVTSPGGRTVTVLRR
jgi:hypothetical protein